MSELEYAQIIASNLRRIMNEHNKSQADIAKDLHISKATVSSWINGTRIPRMPKIDLLCHYFNVKRTDIMEIYDGEKNTIENNYLTPNESDLIDNFRKLNSKGQEKAIDYVSDLAEQKKYTKEVTQRKMA